MNSFIGVEEAPIARKYIVNFPDNPFSPPAAWSEEGRGSGSPTRLFALHGRMIEAMTGGREISEHLATLKREMHDLRETDARYWSRKVRTEQDESAHVSRQSRLLQIKQELLGMMQRYASREYSATRQKSCN